jgi:hypothetical protein
MVKSLQQWPQDPVFWDKITGEKIKKKIMMIVSRLESVSFLIAKLARGKFLFFLVPK